MAIILPDLPYAYDALEPYIDAETMHLHHDKHHQAYVNNANAALEKHPEIGEDLEALLADVDSIPADIRQALINNGGGHLNHALFWELMTPEKTAPSAELAAAIVVSMTVSDMVSATTRPVDIVPFDSFCSSILLKAFVIPDRAKLAHEATEETTPFFPIKESKIPLNL